MRLRAFLGVLAFSLVLAPFSYAVDYQEKWVYHSTNLLTDKNIDDTIALMKDARASGCTHMLLDDWKFGHLGLMEKHYFENVARLKAAAGEIGIKIIPAIYPIGYSGSYLRLDPNLAAGIPVKDAPFVVKGGFALPDPSSVPAVANPGFDEARGDRLTGWTLQDFPGERTFVDKTTKHSGEASLKMTNLNTIPAELAGHCRVMQVLKTRPFQYYRLSVWTKTDGLNSEEAQVTLLSQNEKRTHCFKKFGIKPTEDWTKHEVVFNTLEASEIQMYVGLWGATKGTIWWDDLKVEPAGLLNVLRADLSPLKVTSADGSVACEEGKDFRPVADPRLGENDYAIDHEPPVLTLADNSRIKSGDKLLVSYFHPAVIYDDQVTCSVQNPKIFDLMEDQMKRMTQLWGAPGYFMSYDEIRVGGWEIQPGGARLTPGQFLAKHIARGVEIAHKYAPAAALYVWSDMFDPYHNARPAAKGGFYYLVNGTWDGSWEGLPKDVVVCTWISQAESLKWFAGRGNRQIMAGYYDGPVRPNIEAWMKASKGVPNIIGMMYTTWRSNYKDLPDFFALLSKYPNWRE